MSINKKITLSSISSEDALFLLAIKEDSEVKKFTINPFSGNEETQLNWIKNELTKPFLGYLIARVNEVKVGVVKLTKYSQIHRTIEIGLDLHPDYRGKGLSYLIYEKIIHYVFNTLNIQKVSLCYIEGNLIGEKVYKKLGFVVEGRFKRQVCKSGVYKDLIYMAKFKDE